MSKAKKAKSTPDSNLSKALHDTIAAVATPPGHGGVAVLRVSGPRVKIITPIILKKSIPPRQAVFSGFYSNKGEIIDQGLALFFPCPHSFTGEDILELHSHGSPVVTDWLLESVLQAGARMARAGEFSERAFLNGKMDLTKAEAVADLIDASSRAAARCALRSLQGEFSTQIQQFVTVLTALRVQVEAKIDFSDEEIECWNTEDCIASLNALIQRLRILMRQAEEGSRLCRGVNVVIAGPPNAGKSSLLNVLSGRESAIVTDIPGTTRDVLRENILLDGMSLQISDTAGLRDGSLDPVEQEGIRRTNQEITSADLVLFVSDASIGHALSADRDVPCIAVRNKIDLTGERASMAVSPDGDPVVSLSVQTKTGIDYLIQAIRHVTGITGSESVFSARRRHLDALLRTEAHLLATQQHLKKKQMLDCAAEELRLAQQRLGEITGEFTPDDLLGEIFSSFCVGK